jgi:hypothetical protein
MLPHVRGFMQRVFLTILATSLLVGCTDAPTAPGTGLRSTHPPVTSVKNAASRGAVVVRGLLALGFIILDERNELTSVIGFTEAELADFCITGNTQPHLAEFLDVIRPTGTVKESWKGEDDPVLIWPFLSDNLCGVLASTAPRWAGTTDWRGTDNEVFGLGEGPAANSVGFQAHGEVTDSETGDELRYQAAFRIVVSPDGEEVIGVPAVHINLR